MTKRLTTSAYNKLLGEAAELYPLVNEIQRIIMFAGLVVGEANLQGTGYNMWDSVLSLAEKKGKLDTLLTVLLREYDQRPILLELQQAINDGSAFIEKLEWSEFIKNRAGRAAKTYLVYDLDDLTVVRSLKSQLNILKLNGTITIFDMHQDSKGSQDIQKTRLENLGDADIVLLMLTKNFFQNETNGCLPLAFTAFDMRKRVVPVLLSNCLYNRIILLSEIVPLPKNGVFVNKWASKDEALMVIAEGVEEIAQKLID